MPLSVEPQLLAYRLDRSFYAQAIVLYTESDSCVHNLASQAHHQLHTPPEHTRYMSNMSMILNNVMNFSNMKLNLILQSDLTDAALFVCLML